MLPPVAHTVSFVVFFLNAVGSWWQRRRRQKLWRTKLTHLHPNWFSTKDAQKSRNNTNKNTILGQDCCNSLMFNSQTVSFSISNAHVSLTVPCAHSMLAYLYRFPNENKSQKMIFLLRFFMLRNLTNSVVAFTFRSFCSPRI